MPRIRRIKDYDFDINGEESSNEGDSEPSQLLGESWLSAKAVISRIPDATLRRTLKYYREVVTTIENEIRQRDNGLKQHVNEDCVQAFKYIRFPQQYSEKPVRSILRVSSRQDKTRKTLQGFVKKLALTATQKSQLLNEWHEIFKTLNKELHNGKTQNE